MAQRLREFMGPATPGLLNANSTEVVRLGVTTLLTCYQRATNDALLAVMTEERKVRDATGSLGKSGIGVGCTTLSCRLMPGVTGNEMGNRCASGASACRDDEATRHGLAWRPRVATLKGSSDVPSDFDFTQPPRAPMILASR